MLFVNPLQLFEVVPRLTESCLRLLEVLLGDLEVPAQVLDRFRVLYVAVDAFLFHLSLVVDFFLQLRHLFLELKDLRLLIDLVDECVAQALKFTVRVFRFALEFGGDLRV